MKFIGTGAMHSRGVPTRAGAMMGIAFLLGLARPAGAASVPTSSSGSAARMTLQTRDRNRHRGRPAQEQPDILRHLVAREAQFARRIEQALDRDDDLEF